MERVKLWQLPIIWTQMWPEQTFFSPVSWFFLTVPFVSFLFCRREEFIIYQGCLFFHKSWCFIERIPDCFCDLLCWALQVCTETVIGTCFGIWTRGLDGVYAIYSLWNVIYDICVAGKWIFLVEMTVDVFFWGACLQISNKGGLKMKIFMF